MSVISHITLGTNNPDRAGRFYDEVLGALGFERLPKPPGTPGHMGKRHAHRIHCGYEGRGSSLS